MPLKHFTETFLVIVLGAVIALTGLLIATLPALPAGALPWATLFVLSIIYPLSLYSMFQKRRADNTFRNLHWIPSLMLLVWLLLQGVILGSSLEMSDVSVFTWAWSLPVVFVGFIAIVMYCLKVIRRRVPRLLLLAAILVPFAALAFLSENGGKYEKELASLLWGADFWQIEDSGMIASWFTDDKKAKKNLEESKDPKEEEWRKRMRAQEKRDARIAAKREAQMQQGSSSSLSSSPSSSSYSSEHVMISSVSSRPATLASSGLGWTFIISLMIISYSAVLHQRARVRA